MTEALVVSLKREPVTAMSSGHSSWQEWSRCPAERRGVAMAAVAMAVVVALSLVLQVALASQTQT